MNPKYRVVIVGCGTIGGLHEEFSLPVSYSHGMAFHSHQSFEIVGCIDKKLSRAREFSNRYGVNEYGVEIDQIIKKTKPHIVCVCTPDTTHYDITMAIFSSSGSHLKLIFLEKPVCENQSELSKLLEQSESKNVSIVVNMSRRYHAWYKWIKENYRSGRLGSLVRSDIHYYGGWIHNGVHGVDVVHFLFNEALINGKIFESWSGPISNDPTYSARFETCKGGAPVWFHGFSEEYYQVFDCDFKFSNGRLRITNFEEQLVWQKSVSNDLGEKILMSENIDIEGNIVCPIEEAVTVMEKYLRDDNKTDLTNHLLQDVESTMNVVWGLTGKNA